MDSILRVKLSPSDVFGAIKVMSSQVKGIREFRLKWEEKRKPGVSEGYVRLVTLSKVTEGKEIRLGQAAITAEWDGELSEATITTWTVPWKLVMESHVFLASIFEFCRIVQVKSFAVGAQRVGAEMPALDELSAFTLIFDVQTEGAIAQPASSRDLQLLRKWVEGTSGAYGQKVGRKSEIKWSFLVSDVAWQRNMFGFVARPPEKELTSIYFTKVGASMSSTSF